jgi:hypothetical protein
VRDKPGGNIYGTYFLLAARELDLTGIEPVVVTASRVVGRHGEGISKPEKAQVVFEAMDPPLVLGLAQELSSSPPTALGTTIFRLRTVLEDLKPLPVARDLPSLDDPQRVYLIGHVEGNGLNFSSRTTSYSITMARRGGTCWIPVSCGSTIAPRPRPAAPAADLQRKVGSDRHA